MSVLRPFSCGDCCPSNDTPHSTRTAMESVRRTMGPGAGLRVADASPPLAEAKLAPPRPRAGIVHRQRVVRALEAGLEASLTLVAAPPGYGKTTAVRAWCASRQI